MIVDDLADKTLEILKNGDKLTLKEYSIAIPYAYVIVEGEKGVKMGVSMVLDSKCHYRRDFDETSLESIIECAKGYNLTERTLAMAAINAVSQYYIDFTESKNEDVLDLIVSDKDIKKIGFVGNIAPVVNELREIDGKNYEIYVFERNSSSCGAELLDDTFEYRLLPEMDAVIITGTTLVNDTIDVVLERSKNAKLKILTGPTAQINPDFLKNSGITHTASTRVISIDKTVTDLKHGSSFGIFSRNSSKYSMKVKDNNE